MKKNDLPIGVFDSGVGGLTVVREIIRELPHESIIYLGDTARVPYGTRSPEVITKFALELVNFLLSKKVKALVVACNTISANALSIIKKISPVPVIDVIEPTEQEALKIGKNIAVIGTVSTVSSQAFPQFRERIACPLFIPLAEEGMTSGMAVEEITRGYLSALSDKKIDTLILGCTHFPVLLSAIAKTMGGGVKLVISGPATARFLRHVLTKQKLLRKKANPGYQFFFTDSPDRSEKVGETFFGGKLPGSVTKINL